MRRKKCRHPANKFVADYLQEELTKLLGTPKENLQWVYKKALRSVLEHSEELTCVEDCLKLKGIGNYVGFRMQKLFVENNRRVDNRVTPGSNHTNSTLSGSACKSINSNSISLAQGAGSFKKFGCKWSLLLILGCQESYVAEHVVEKHLENMYRAFPKPKQKLSSASFLRHVRELETFSYLRRTSNGLILTKQGATQAIEFRSDEGALSLLQKAGFKPEKTEDGALTSSTKHLLYGNKNTAKSASGMQIETRQFRTAKKRKLGRSDTLTPRYNITPRLGTHPGDSSSRSEGLLSEWELVLIIDNREKVSHRDRDFFFSHLREKGVNVENRALPLGDFLWIMRRKDSHGEDNEYVCDYIIERKQIDDFVSSIKDGRYVEQKIRLKRARLQRLMYLVEGKVSSGGSAQYIKAMHTAMAETQVLDGIMVKQCNDGRDSVNFLCRIHKLLESMSTHSGSPWFGPTSEDENVSDRYTYAQFRRENAKLQLRTVSEIFGAQLKQLKGMSGQKVETLLKIHSTPSSLVKAFGLDEEIKGSIQPSDTLDKKRREEFQEIKDQNGRRFGPAIGNMLMEFFCK